EGVRDLAGEALQLHFALGAAHPSASFSLAPGPSPASTSIGIDAARMHVKRMRTSHEHGTLEGGDAGGTYGGIDLGDSNKSRVIPMVCVPGSTPGRATRSMSRTVRGGPDGPDFSRT